MPPTRSGNNEAKTMISDGKYVAFPALQVRNVALAYDYVFHPFPENRANEVAQSRLIERDLRDPGVQSDGLLPEDCVNLPPAHCRPPGTYTGHKKRDLRGPFEVFKAITSELIKCIAQKPRRARIIPQNRPAVTSRAACRSRKIMKDTIRRQNTKLQPRRISTARVQKRPIRGLRAAHKAAQKLESSSKRHGSNALKPATVELGAGKNGDNRPFRRVSNGPSEGHRDQENQAAEEGEGTEANGQGDNSKTQAPTTQAHSGSKDQTQTQIQPGETTPTTSISEPTLHPRDYRAHDAQEIADGEEDNVSPELRQAFETWQASFHDEEVGPEPTQATQAEPQAEQDNNDDDRNDAENQLQEDLNRAADENVVQAPQESLEPPQTPPPQIKKVVKTRKASKTADRELQDIAQQLSPKNINKRTRAQRRNNQAEPESQKGGEGSEKPGKKKAKRQDKGKAKAETKDKKIQKKKTSRNPKPVKDKAYKPCNDEDSDDSDQKKKTSRNAKVAKDKAYKPRKDDDSDTSEDHNLDSP